MPRRGRAIGDALLFCAAAISAAFCRVSYGKKRERIGVFFACWRALCVCAFGALYYSRRALANGIGVSGAPA